MLGHVRTESADFKIYRIWAIFLAIYRIVMHLKPYHLYLWNSRDPIRLPRGQVRTMSHMIEVVSSAYFSRYNSNLLDRLSLEVIAQSKVNVIFEISVYKYNHI